MYNVDNTYSLLIKKMNTLQSYNLNYIFPQKIYRHIIPFVIRNTCYNLYDNSSLIFYISTEIILKI